MICPECKKENVKSKVYSGGGSSTLLGWETYYDEDGYFHIHDPNWKTTGYTCSNGHRWAMRSKKECPNSKICGYVGSEVEIL